MSLTFPRKFAHGQKVGNVDVYGELYLWPDGHFQYMVHIRNRDPMTGCCVKVNFALLDHDGALLGIYGMPADQAWCVAPWGDVQAGQRYDELFGKVPENKLQKVSAVALLFSQQNQEPDAVPLQKLATIGSELVFCPPPD